MNPTVPEHVIADALAADEPAARAEYFAEFRRDLEAFVSREVIEAATVPHRLGLPPVDGVSYIGFTDPSGGAADEFTLAIAHAETRDGAKIGVLDYLAARRPPFSPDAVVAEHAAALKSYGVTTVQSDRYAGAWVEEAFAKCGITCRQSAEPKSTIYANLLPLLNSGRVALLDHPGLQAQLLGLERRTARGGRDSIDHAPNGHDDLSNAVAGVLVATIGPGDPSLNFYHFLEREAERRAQERTDAAPGPSPWAGRLVSPRPPAREEKLAAYERLERRVAAGRR